MRQTSYGLRIRRSWLVWLTLLLVVGRFAVAQDLPTEFRTINGTNNSAGHADWGSAGIELVRYTREFFGGESVDYSDGVNAPAGQGRPSARAVSDAIATQTLLISNSVNASDFVWQWGQFLDHDIDLTGAADPMEPMDIPVPAGDPFFDPGDTGSAVITFARSLYEHESAPRQQMNQITAWIDASNVYGSDEERAAELRTFKHGELKKGRHKLLPFNVDGFPERPEHGRRLLHCWRRPLQ